MDFLADEESILLLESNDGLFVYAGFVCVCVYGSNLARFSNLISP